MWSIVVENCCVESCGGDKYMSVLYDDWLQRSDAHCATLLASLKACTKLKDLHSGSRIHIQIAQSGLIKKNVVVGNTLVNMYAKCGAFEKAQEVFDELPVRDTVSWNVLIAGYAQQGRGEEALKCFECMLLGGFSPNAVTLASILKVCTSAEKAQALHGRIVKDNLLQNNIHVGTALVDTYAKCGLLGKAQDVFRELQVRDVVSWTALIMGYAHHGHVKEALNCFAQMQHEGLSPNLVTFACILKACGSMGAMSKGQELHAQISRESLLEKNIVVGNSLVDMYAKCGALAEAQEVFDDLLVWDAVTWTTLITGHVQQGYDEEAIAYFKQMQHAGFSPDAATFASILKACGRVGAVDKGQGIHAQCVKVGLLAHDIPVGTAIIDMYSKCGLLSKAREVFDEIQVRDAVMWNSIISGYAQHEHGEEALNCFKQMQLQGFTGDLVTFASILMVYSGKRALCKGQELHAEIVKIGFLEKDMVVGTGLIDLYANCGMLAEAQQVFDRLPIPDIISWNALIRGYSQHGQSEKVLNCLEQMQLGGLAPDASTCVCALKACGSTGAAVKGQELHAHIASDDLFARDASVGTTLVDMYVKCGLLQEAQDVFEELQVRDVVSWNVLITGHTQHDHGEEALNCFERMKLEGFSLDAASFTGILKACSSIGATYTGQQIHAEAVRGGWLEEEMAVGTALVDMYANCGMLLEARDVFNKLPARDIVSWNALMVGYAQLGEEEILFASLNEILGEGKEPNVVTFIIVLNACSHGGLLDKGQSYFRILSEVYGILPTIEHHTCMADLFCRAGHLQQAVAVIEEMPLFCNLTVWHTLLNACQKWGDAKLGRWAFRNATQVDTRDYAAHVCMSNIYALCCQQDDNKFNAFINPDILRQT